MKRIGWRAGIIPLALLMLCALAYGRLIPNLGVYWDDWPSLWFLHAFGPGIFPDAFSIDRPAQGWLFTLTTAVFGESMLAWHFFGILARWLNGLALYGLLGMIWPQHKIKVLGAVALFLVYPGFSQQLIPITYGHQFLIYTAFLTSLALMVAAQRATLARPMQYWSLTLAALALAVWSMFALEYFFGLELLRPALLGLALYNAADRREQDPAGVQAGKPANYRTGLVRSVLLNWLPYAAAAVLFSLWRISNPTPRGNIVIFDRLAASPVTALIDLAGTILSDLGEVAALAWVRTPAFLNPLGIDPFLWTTGGLLALIAAAAAAWMLWTLQRGSPDRNDRGRNGGWAKQAILLGLYALLIGGWPVWVTDLRLELAFPWDRFTLPLMLGAVLLMSGLIDLLPTRALPKIVLLGVLIGLSTGAQFRYGVNYLYSRNAQNAFFWQLAWRAPAIEPGTVLLTAPLPFTFVTDNSLSAPLNWVYASDLESRRMPYLMYSLEARLGTDLASLEPGTPVIEDYRATFFEGSTSQAVVLFHDPPRCLKVLDPRIDADLPNKPDFILEAMHLSRPELILTQPTVSTATLERLFGPEPDHGWCYYVEKADLAASHGDWPAVVALAAPALAANPDLGRAQAYELLPFIQGYAYTGDWDEAIELSQLSARLFSDKMPALLCDLWQQIEKNAPAGAEATAGVARALTQLNCPVQ